MFDTDLGRAFVGTTDPPTALAIEMRGEDLAVRTSNLHAPEGACVVAVLTTTDPHSFPTPEFSGRLSSGAGIVSGDDAVACDATPATRTRR